MYAVINREAFTLRRVTSKAPRVAPLDDKTLVVPVDAVGQFPKAQLVTLYNSATGEDRKTFRDLLQAERMVREVLEKRLRRHAHTPAPAPEVETPPVSSTASPVPVPRFTKPNGAVARVWRICNANPARRRCDAIAACVAAGINPQTARTQYQYWYTLHREKVAKARAAAAKNTKKARPERAARSAR